MFVVKTYGKYRESIQKKKKKSRGNLSEKFARRNTQTVNRCDTKKDVLMGKKDRNLITIYEGYRTHVFLLRS